MKNIFILIFILMPLFSSSAKADDYVEPGTFTWGIGVGGAATGSGFSSIYSGGDGAGGNLGFILNKNMALLLEIDGYIFNTRINGAYNEEVNILPSFRYTFTEMGIKPYLIGAVGLNDNLSYYGIYPNSNYGVSTSFAPGLGAGITVPINDHLDVYLQAKYETAFASGGSFSYLPVAL